MLKLRDICAQARIIPVLSFDDPGIAAEACYALYRGGIRVFEITLRTPSAWDCARAIKAALPQDAFVGLGTVLNEADLEKASCNGFQFAVSPGALPGLMACAKKLGLPYLPGVSTASEAMLAAQVGFEPLKFFPAEAAGGLGMLKHLAAPLPGISFCPTGGVNGDNYLDYLKLPNVLCVGGSWLLSKVDLRQRDWDLVSSRTQTALQAIDN